MEVHANAPLSPIGRQRTVYRWLARCQLRHGRLTAAEIAEQLAAVVHGLGGPAPRGVGQALAP